MASVHFDKARQRWRVAWHTEGGRLERKFRNEGTARAFAEFIVSPAGRRRPGRNVADRVQENSQLSGSGCWVWQRYVAPTGYGVITHGGRRRLAHRVSYETFVGPIPANLTIDHLCRNRACVNPAHLEAVTSRENVLRSPMTQASINAAKTECPSGHPYDDENTYRYAGGRYCRTCMREYGRARRAAVAS